MKVLKVTSYKLIVANAKLFRGELRPKKYQKKAHPNQYRTDHCLQFQTVLYPTILWLCFPLIDLLSKFVVLNVEQLFVN